MKSGTLMAGTSGRRIALFLVACALVLRLLVPAGWMPQADAAGIALAWCDDSGISGGEAPAEAKALLAKAVGEKPVPAHKPAPDQPCAFAAAAQPLAAVDFAPLPPAPATLAEPLRPTLVATPGRGLAAPPPRSTGPPSLA
ncbi:MAG: hypothetical protein MT490_10590 [Sphingomonas sp.]|uniref:hypothetical protein n=1 Tax=Sphingomonas sp. TaxID=28214 RepID=UPI002272B97C|nr:hypothetical protein [Sphingomonas sp.]MCX8476231.1 hypothetical protein [Sphingomonas sp.]